MRSIPLKDYIEFKYPNYIFLQVIPSSSIRNYNSDNILKTISKLYVNISDKVSKISGKMFFECQSKVGYYVYITKTDMQFYFIVPEKHFLLIKNKIIDTWNNRCTINQVSEIPQFSNSCTKYYMTYKKSDIMSLSCDKRNNTLIYAQASTVNVLEESDRIGVFYNFVPTYTKTWKAKFDRALNDYRNGVPIAHDKLDGKYIARYLVFLLVRIADTALYSVVPKSTKEDRKQIRDLDLSKSTFAKRDADIINTQIVIMSDSQDKARERNNALSICSTFECLSEDNTLTYKRLNTKELNLLRTRIKNADTVKIQPREGQNFISLASGDILKEYNITHTDVLETEVPEQLRQGYLFLGNCKCRDKVQHAYLRDTYDYGNMPLVLIGQQGSGKSTYISNYCKMASDHGDGCIVIDFIKKCELADSIKNALPKDKVIEIDMSDVRSVQGIGYNEFTANKSDPMSALDISNRKSLYISTLIDAINPNGDPLSPSMDRYLSAASNIVFLDRDASLNNVIRCLNNHEYRHQCIDYISQYMRDALQDEISALMELDDKDKAGAVIGTKMSKIDGINSRVNDLKKDLRLKMMYQKGTKDNVDLVKAMDEGKTVLFKMPQDCFATPYSKNVIVTYLMTKIWSTAIIRGSKADKPSRFHVVVDELFQARSSMQLLKSQEILPQTRKFGAKFVLSCQYLGQIDVIDQTLRSAGASYMLLKGSGKSSFSELKEELYPYTLDDIEALPQYSCLNLINYEKGRAKFVTKLPHPLT